MLLPALLLAIQIPNSGMAPGTNIQRTMRLLEEGKPVKIMFYGQSITNSEWPKELEGDLRARFPKAQLETKNLAIGGFAANLLKRTARRDALEQYPDLIILHVYGGEPDYEELVKTLRSSTTAELLLQSDHIHGVATGKPEDKEKDRGWLWHDQHAAWLRKTADKYGCGFVDIRANWYSEMARSGRPFTDFVVADKVHLNESGDKLMASFTGAYLVRDAKLAGPDPVTTRAIEGNELDFVGNRLDLKIAGAEGPVQVLIDDRKPSTIPSLYLPTRTSNALGAWFPALLRVNAVECPALETVTLRLSKFDNTAAQFEFSALGSTTGPDGSGFSAIPFTSRSKRVVITPDDWATGYGFAVSKQMPADGSEVFWSYFANFKDEVVGEEWQTVAKGLSNAAHRLRLVGRFGSASARVFRPGAVE